MMNLILAEMDSKLHMKDRLAQAEEYHFVRAVQAANKARRLERQRLPKASPLQKLVASLGYTAP
jgi:hypothetical protein